MLSATCTLVSTIIKSVTYRDLVQYMVLLHPLEPYFRTDEVEGFTDVIEGLTDSLSLMTAHT